MALKETLDVIVVFGCVAGALTTVKLAREAWEIWGPSKIKNLYDPELQSQMDKSTRDFESLRSRVCALTKQERAPT